MLAGEQVDAAPGRIAERVGDGRHCRGESTGCHRCAGRVRSHAGILPICVVVIRCDPFPRKATMPATTTEQIIEALRPVEDPELRRSIVDLGMVRKASLDNDGVVDVLIALTVAGCPLRNEITSRVTAAVAPLPGVKRVALDFTVMTDQEREAVRMMVHGNPGDTAGQGQAHGHAEGRKVPFAEPGSKTRPLLISSGKGGVGKSSVTVNLAVALAQQGYSVGIVDADIYGFSIPRMLGADRDPVVIDQMLVPPESHGVRCISIGYFVPEGQAVDLARPDAAQGARAVPHRRLLGRARLPAHRHAARHRRHRPQPQPVPAARRGLRRHHSAARRPEGRRAVGSDGRKGQHDGQGRHREHELVHRRRRQALRDLR